MLSPAESFRRPLARVIRERELEQARRLGRWQTAEDLQLVREHQSRLVLAQAGRAGALGLLMITWFVPVLWPFALVGSARAFPRTTRRVGLVLVGGGAVGVASLVGLVLLIGQLNHPQLPQPAPQLPQAAPSLLPPAADGVRSPG